MKTIILAILLSISLTANAQPDYEQGIAGWTVEELKAATMKCILKEIPHIDSKFEFQMIETICFYKVIGEGQGN